MKTWQVLPLIAISVFAAIAQERKVAAIDFFGHQGMDIETIRRTLPFHEGEIAPKGGFRSWKDSARKAVLAVTGRESTDQALVCCWNGNWFAYIGLRGSSFVEPKLKSAPVGSTRLPKEFMKLDREFNRAWEESVKTGQREHLNTQWRAMREMAPRHEPALLDAGVNAADSVHRAAAVFAIGHALAPSTSRLFVLLDAAHDPDSTVRNNAVRGLGEWAHQYPEWRRKIPPDVGIDLVRSGTWSDRNKGAFLLSELTEARDEGMLGKIREQAMPSLREMAAWRWSGHNTAARLILGRIAGIEEAHLRKMIDDGNVAEVLRNLR